MTRRRPKIRYLAVLAVLVWATYYYWHVQHQQLMELTAKADTLQAQLATATRQHNTLVNESQEFRNKTYLERYATQHFNLILPNQVTFTLQGKTP